MIIITCNTEKNKQLDCISKNNLILSIFKIVIGITICNLTVSPCLICKKRNFPLLTLSGFTCIFKLYPQNKELSTVTSPYDSWSSSWLLEISGTHCYPTLSHAASVISKDLSIRSEQEKVPLKKVSFVQGRNFPDHFWTKSHSFLNSRKILKLTEQKPIMFVIYLTNRSDHFNKTHNLKLLLPNHLKFIILLICSYKLPKNTHN